MKELKNSKVYFDNPNNVCKPGEFLTGRVEINLNSPKTVRGIFLTISGKASVYWLERKSTGDSNEGSSTKAVSYTNEERYFKEKLYVTGDEKGSKLELPAGQYVYPFKFLLPSNLPPSFGDKKNVGKIIYKVKATLDRPWEMNKCIEEPFIMKTTTIQNCPKIKEPQILKIDKQLGLIFKSKPIIVTVKTPQSGFRAGEIIQLAVDVNNGSDIAIKSISVKLREISTFHATTKTRTEEKTLSKHHITNQVGPNSTMSFNHKLTVPNDLLLHDLTNCKIIDLTYVIKVELHTTGLTQNLSGTITMLPISS